MRRMLAVLVVALAACGSSSKPASTTGARLTVTSPVLQEGQAIPVRYTCSGEGVSPPLAWSGIPKGTGSIAVVVDDPDAPGGTFVHWVVTGLPPTQTSLAEGGSGFRPPCPPAGRAHHYRFSVYALAKAGPTTPGAIRSHAIASGTLTATFAR